MGQLDVCGCVLLGVVSRGASWERAAKILVPRVSLHVVIQAELDVELLPTYGAFILLVVSTALLLTVFPPMLALEIFPTIRTERVTGHSYHISNMYSKFEKSLHFSKWWGTIWGLWYHAMRIYFLLH